MVRCSVRCRLYDNIAFPLRDTKKKEDEVRRIVMEKVEMVGLLGAEDKLAR